MEKDMKLTYNYHTHTIRCGHASGTDEEYVQRAIECGVEYMGFSDHVPFAFPDGRESAHRVPVAMAKEYVDSFSALREKYKDKIDIKIGFEVEYYPEFFDRMLKEVVGYGAEYLILGQHYMYNELEGCPHVIAETDSVDEIKKYADRVIEAMKTGVFTYIAHPDMFNYTGDVENFKAEMRKICIASKEMDIPLEINLLGIRGNRNYPNEAFWEVAGEVGSPVTVGHDAHEAKDACDHISFERAKEIVNKYNLNYIGKPNVILIQDI